MRTWHWLAASIVWCAGCADGESPSSEGAAPDSGDYDAGDYDGGDYDDAGGEDAALSDAGHWLSLTPEQKATDEAKGDIAALECDVFEPCGGDPVGTWNIAGLCLDDVISVATAGVQNCPGLLTSYERIPSGTMSFQDDGTYAMDLMITGRQRLRLDDACAERLYDAPAQDACAMYEEHLNGGAATHVATCAMDGDACSCEVEVENSLVFEGFYRVSALWLNDNSMLAPFCVEDDTFSIEYQFSNRRFALHFTRAESE